MGQGGRICKAQEICQLKFDKLSTYHSWFMTGDIPQEELEAGYPQGMPRYIRHTSGIPFTYVKIQCSFVLVHTILLLKLGGGLVPNCQGSIVYVQNVPAQWLRMRYTFFLNAQHMREFVRSIIPFCLHSLEVVRKLLVQ